jgi:hypothetical protein
LTVLSIVAYCAVAVLLWRVATQPFRRGERSFGASIHCRIAVICVDGLSVDDNKQLRAVVKAS